MCARLNNFRIIIFLITVLVSPSSTKSISCPYDLSVELEGNKTLRFENGSVFHEGILYSPDSYWRIDNTTYGCPCRQPRICLQKCCGERENLVEEGEKQVCREVREDLIIPDLKVEAEYMADEMKVLGMLSERFSLVNNRLSECSGLRMKLEPEDYADDKFVLQANGSLHYRDSMLPQSMYCVDWNEILDRSLVVVCILPKAAPVEAETHVYPVGMIVSIPFFLATFLVYAIIPELRNLYGKTLMCYVGCLISAYSFLSYAIFRYAERTLCTVMVSERPIVQAVVSSQYCVDYWLENMYFPRAVPLPLSVTIHTLMSVMCCSQIEEYIADSEDLVTNENFMENPALNHTVLSEEFNKSLDEVGVQIHQISDIKSVLISAKRREIYRYSTEESVRRRDSEETNDEISINTNECPNGTSCVAICCEPNSFFNDTSCEFNDTLPWKDTLLPRMYKSDLQPSEKSPENFTRIYGIPCQGTKLLVSASEDYFHLLENGKLRASNFPDGYDKMSVFNYTDYCFATAYEYSQPITIVMICVEESTFEISLFYPITMIFGMPFLVATFVVYSVLPELDTIHGKCLRAYIVNLFFATFFLTIIQIGDQAVNSKIELCIALAFIIHFSFLSSFFWLNVMCFDIWWTFGGFRSLQGSAKQRERKKFTLYSIYAWGSASLITGICILMDYLPNIPENFIKPEFGVESCWFKADAARAIYFYGPMGVTVFCNICLFISTAIKIGQHKKDTAHHLKSSESRRHDDNKQWFNLYLKLFIVMGINWSMEIISWLCKGPQYVWYITDLPNSLQGLIIFIIFVWKDKIKRLLLKRFGCHGRNFHSRNSTRSVYNSSASRTCTTSAPLQEKTNPFVNENTRNNKVISEESDCA